MRLLAVLALVCGLYIAPRAEYKCDRWRAMNCQFDFELGEA